jgi:hypothetical protein
MFAAKRPVDADSDAIPNFAVPKTVALIYFVD